MYSNVHVGFDPFQILDYVNQFKCYNQYNTMPEGPEVWILAKALKMRSHGKHLILSEQESWSFGLTGTVKLLDDGTLTKVETGKVYGSTSVSNNKLGVDWMTSDINAMQNVVNKWTTSKSSVASLLLDQTNIAGIGVAWGSEILHIANILPNKKGCDQDLSNLVLALSNTRDTIKEIYTTVLTQNHVHQFVNNWFFNLYAVRHMKMYKCGTPIRISGRTWWV